MGLLDQIKSLFTGKKAEENQSEAPVSEESNQAPAENDSYQATESNEENKIQ